MILVIVYGSLLSSPHLIKVKIPIFEVWVPIRQIASPNSRIMAIG
jgi:hypothetical protein